MRYSEIFDLILERARLIGIKNPETGLVDAVDCELAMYSILLDLLGRYDLDGYTVTNPTMFTTSPGERRYALPDDFARFVTPRDRDLFGVGINNGSQNSQLIYREPPQWLRQQSTTPGKPAYYTVSDGWNVLLDPAPDSNNSLNYTGNGVYVRDIPIDEVSNGRVPVGYAPALQHLTLAQLAMDTGHARADALQAEAAAALTSLVNGQERARLKFQRPNTTLGRSGRYWRTQ